MIEAPWNTLLIRLLRTTGYWVNPIGDTRCSQEYFFYDLLVRLSVLGELDESTRRFTIRPRIGTTRERLIGTLGILGYGRLTLKDALLGSTPDFPLAMIFMFEYRPIPFNMSSYSLLPLYCKGNPCRIRSPVGC